MTKTERFSEESSHCYTYDSLVREMASAMEVNSEMIYPVKEGQFDYEDIESWIGAVSFKEGKAPNIQASLSSDRGLRVVKFDVADQKAIKSLDEKATKEQLIFTMALTMAKMKVISDIAEETYPAVAFQIADYRKEMEKVLNEILSDKRENTSLENLIKKVTSRKGLVAVLVIGGMILAACGVIADKVTPEGRFTSTPNEPPVTETVPAMATATTEVIEPTATPETVATATATAEPTIEPTATEVVVRTEFARGELMTPEEIKVNVDWYYNLSDEELNQMTRGKLWSFSEYKGDSRPRDLDGNILSETQDLGYVHAISYTKESNTVVGYERYNAVFLGITKIKDGKGVEYLVGALGMKDARGERMVTYGVYGVANQGRVSGAIFHSSLYDGVRYFGNDSALPFNEDEFVQKLLNEQTKKVILLELGQITEYGSYSPTKEVALLEKTRGDEALYEMLLSQSAGGAESPKAYFEEILDDDGKLPLGFSEDKIARLARIALLGIDE